MAWFSGEHVVQTASSDEQSSSTDSCDCLAHAGWGLAIRL